MQAVYLVNRYNPANTTGTKGPIHKTLEEVVAKKKTADEYTEVMNKKASGTYNVERRLISSVVNPKDLFGCKTGFDARV